MKSWLNQFMLHLWYPTSAMILAWILEECLRYNTIYSNFIIVIVVTVTIIILSNVRLLEAGHLNVCYSFVYKFHYQCSMLCSAQWQKSPGVFMRKKGKEFTIEDGTHSYTN